MRRLFALMVLSTVAAVGIGSTQAAATNSPAPASPEKKADPPPKTGLAGRVQFRGPVQALDAKAKTITVSNLVIQVTSDTRIQKSGKPGVFADIQLGEEIRGSYLPAPAPSAKPKAFSVFIGTKAGADPKAKPAPPKTTPKKEEPLPKN
jgi:hypothetical protein